MRTKWMNVQEEDVGMSAGLYGRFYVNQIIRRYIWYSVYACVFCAGLMEITDTSMYIVLFEEKCAHLLGLG